MRLLNPKTVVQFINYEKEEKSGFLWKRRNERKGSFKRRYFIACGNLLAYFEKKSDKEPLGVLLLDGHFIEMLGDLTMALRFPNFNDILRSYVLRGETVEDVEQWMRVLSRSGIDFFKLTLEDLEDQLSAVTTVRKSISSTSDSSTHDVVFFREVKRTNPFNRTSIIHNDSKPPHPSSTLSSSISCNNAVAPLSSTTTQQSVSCSISPSNQHLQWLCMHNWDELHARAKTQFTNCLN